MRGHYDEVKAKGAEVVAIGMGIPEMAADFRDKQDIPFRLLVDRTKQTYRALEIPRGNLWQLVGPQPVLRGMRNLLTGNWQGIVRQDPYQLGGTAIVEPSGEIRYLHRAKDSSDNYPVGEILARL